MDLEFLPGEYTIARAPGSDAVSITHRLVELLTRQDQSKDLVSVSRTYDEVSLVGPTHLIGGVTSPEDSGWTCFKVVPPNGKENIDFGK